MPPAKKIQLDWFDIAKTTVFVISNIVVAAGVGGWKAHASMSDLREQVHANQHNIEYHDNKFEEQKRLFDKEFELRDQRMETHFNDLNKQLDGIQKQLDLTHSDVRDLRKRVDQALDHHN